MNASVHILPVWKKDSTPAEWLQELAAMALANPERFAQVVVVYEEVTGDNALLRTRMQTRGMKSNTDIMGTLACAEKELWDYMKGRTTL